MTALYQRFEGVFFICCRGDRRVRTDCSHGGCLVCLLLDATCKMRNLTKGLKKKQ